MNYYHTVYDEECIFFYKLNNVYTIIGDAGKRRRLLWNAFDFGLWKELLLLAVDVMLC
jgi:hypothetical protein